MADTVLVKYEADVSDLDRELNSVIKKNEEVQSSATKAGKAVNDSFIAGSQGAKRFQQELDRQPKTLAELELKLRNLRELLRDDTKIGTEGFKRVSNEIKKTETEIGKMNNQLKQTKVEGLDIQKVFSRLGGILAATFAVDRIIAFSKESVLLAANTEGVRKAFNDLNDPALLNNLRRATKGLITDLELMSKANFAEQLGIDLAKLPTILEFARRVAKRTGDDFDFLSRQIIVGIGRKSTQRLDDFGITADKVREKLGGVSIEAVSTAEVTQAVFEIAQEELAGFGEEVDTTGDKIRGLNVDLKNTQVILGQAWIQAADGALDALSPLTDNVERLSNLLSGIELPEFVNSENALAVATNVLTTALNTQLGGWFQILVLIDQVADSLDDTNEEMKETVSISDALRGVFDQLGVEEETQINNIALLEKQLKELNKELKNAEIGSTGFFNLVDRVAKTTKELNEAIAQTKLADALKVDDETDDNIIGAVIDYPEEVQRSTDIATQIFNRHFEELMDIQDTVIERDQEAREEAHEANLRRLQQEREAAWQVLDGVVQLGVTIGQIQQNSLDQQLQNLEERYNQGRLTREQFENEERAIRRKSAESQKALAIFQAVVGTAASITQALGNVPPPASYILAGISAALGAAQIAVIASEPIPQFAEGVIGLQGEGTETSDSIHAKLSKGESVMTAAETRKHRGVLEAIRNNTLENYIYQNEVAPIVESIMKGGFAGLGASYALNERFNDKNLLRGTDRLRESNKDGFIYLGDRLERALTRKSKSRYV